VGRGSRITKRLRRAASLFGLYRGSGTINAPSRGPLHLDGLPTLRLHFIQILGKSRRVKRLKPGAILSLEWQILIAPRFSPYQLLVQSNTPSRKTGGIEVERVTGLLQANDGLLAVLGGSG
jgi:hypothetical protein